MSRAASSRITRTFHSEGDPTLRALPLDEWGIGGLLPRIIEEASDIGDPVAAATHVFGLGGRVSPEVGVAAMPRRERVAWSFASRAPAAPERVGPSWAESAVMVRSDGRVRLGAPQLRKPRDGDSAAPHDWLPADDVAARLAPLEFDRESWQAWREADELAQTVLRYDGDCLCEWEAELALQGGERLVGLLLNVNGVLQHAAPLIWFVDTARYSNFVDENLPGKSLLPAAPRSVFRPQQLDELMTRRIEDRYALMAADLLLRAGGPHRLEERNWTQVRPAELREHLTRALERYVRLGGEDPPAPPDTGTPWCDLVRLADHAVQARERLAARRQRYRSISAAVLHKREEFADPSSGEEAEERFGHALVRVTRHAAGPRLHATAELQEYLAEVVEHGAACGRFATALEEALALTAYATLVAANADVAMTRGHRSPADIERDVVAGAWDRLAAREQREFYCCVLPHARVLLAAERRRLAESLWAMAARMQYNSWHFLGGNLPAEREVRDRDRFLPPKIPDVSAWSDQHHRGHISTGVRYSVRAPAAVDIAGRPFYGFCDTRLLRYAGTPFDETEMMIGLTGARHAARLIESALQHARSSGAEPTIDAFSRPFYIAGEFAAIVEEVRL